MSEKFRFAAEAPAQASHFGFLLISLNTTRFIPQQPLKWDANMPKTLLAPKITIP